MEASKADERKIARARALRVHALAFAGAGAVMFVIDLAFFDGRWFHWPVMAWGAIVGVQALYCKSLAVDDDWAERRARRIRLKSYDFGHIRDIEDSFEEGRMADETTNNQNT